MDKYKKYRRIRRIFEFVSYIIAFIIGNIISSYLKINNKKFFSADTALSLAIIVVIAVVLNNITVKIADNWYTKNKEK